MEIQPVLKKWGFRLLKFVAFLSLTTGFSVLSYWKLYSSWSKKDVNMIPLYFDFRGDESVANVSFALDAFSHRNRAPTFPTKLVAGQSYSVQSMFYVAKSPRNQQLGKVTVVMNIIDAGGEVVDSSIRPLIVPYHSSIYLVLESIFLFPLKFFNLHELYQYELIMLDMFPNYVERHTAYPPTTRMEVILSDSQIDLLDTFVIVSRNLSWISKLLLRRPILCFFVGVSLINSTILMSCLAIYVYHRMKNMPPEGSIMSDDALMFDSSVIQAVDDISIEGGSDRAEGLRRRRR